MIVGLVRFSYLNVFKPRETPGGQMKYSVCCLIPKSDKKLVNSILSAIEEARAKGVEVGKFSKAQSKAVRVPMRDGDAELKSGQKSGPEYKGMYFFNCTSDDPIGIVGPDNKPVLDTSEWFSGCWGYVDVGFFPYNTGGNRGVGAGLNNIMFKKADDRLDGRMKAEDAFADLAEEQVGDELV